MFNTKILFSATVMSFAVLLGACQKDKLASSSDGASISSESGLQQRSSKSSSGGIDLGQAGNFVMLSKSGITNVYKSTVTGDIGTSPITGAAIDLSCAEVKGAIYTVDAAGPLPCSVTDATRLTTAVGDMQTAYTDAAGRINPNFLNLGAGDIGGKTLTPGLYNWTSALLIPTDITIAGGPNDIWIFQVAGTLNVSSAVNIILSGGAQAKNIYWQVADAVTLGTTSHFEGNILGQTGINMLTGASINGRMLAQTAVTLQMNTVTLPL
jgi:Ice-binding-like